MSQGQGFEDIAAGARELRVEIRKGDILARAGEGERWSFQWSSDGGERPHVEREGDVVRVRQRPSGFLPAGLDLKRVDVRFSLPASLEIVELRTGMGRVDAEGLGGRSILITGNGALSLRASQGEANLTTGNGEMSIEDFSGSLTASTGNGRVRVNRLGGNLSLNTGNGPMEVLDAEGRVRASTGNGDLRLLGVAGEVELNTGHGRVEIGAPRSLAVQANTAMGGIRVDGGSVRSLRANTMVGDIECSALLEPGTYELSSGMGAVGVQLAPHVPARVDAQTGFGQVDSDFPLVRVGRSGPMGFGGVRMVGSIGEGEPRVEVSMRSGKGAIRIRRTHAAPAAAASAAVASEWRAAPRVPEPPRPSHGFPTPRQVPHMTHVAEDPGSETDADSTLAVLEAVARGEISPEEADEMLRQVGT
ncbi:MAG: DUF4097 family beta strand repeat-containing protein [Chloroflexota bacterium]|nr:DUF4097 family beta strand repeat-containing protein [Chloroflexota bacterium]